MEEWGEIVWMDGPLRMDREYEEHLNHTVFPKTIHCRGHSQWSGGQDDPFCERHLASSLLGYPRACTMALAAGTEATHVPLDQSRSGYHPSRVPSLPVAQANAESLTWLHFWEESRGPHLLRERYSAHFHKRSSDFFFPYSSKYVFWIWICILCPGLIECFLIHYSGTSHNIASNHGTHFMAKKCNNRLRDMEFIFLTMYPTMLK